RVLIPSQSAVLVPRGFFGKRFAARLAFAPIYADSRGLKGVPNDAIATECHLQAYGEKVMGAPLSHSHAIHVRLDSIALPTFSQRPFEDAPRYTSLALGWSVPRRL